MLEKLISGITPINEIFLSAYIRTPKYFEMVWPSNFWLHSCINDIIETCREHVIRYLLFDYYPVVSNFVCGLVVQKLMCQQKWFIRYIHGWNLQCLTNVLSYAKVDLYQVRVLCQGWPVPSQGHCGFPTFPVVDWFCLFVDLWVLPFPLEDCSMFGNFVITLIFWDVANVNRFRSLGHTV